MKKMRILLVMLLVFTSTVVFAADVKKKYVPSCGANEIIVATGDSKGTYSSMMQSIERIDPSLICEYADTSGGFDNVNLILSKKADAGIVQVDVIQFMSQKEPKIGKRIKSLVALHDNAVHIIVNRNGFPIKDESRLGRLLNSTKVVAIEDIRDLKGLPIVGFGSGFITARNVDDMLNIGFGEILEAKTKEEAWAMVEKGEVAAMIAMGGWPIPWVDEKLDRSIFTLANVEAKDINNLKSPFFASKLSYGSLGVMGANAITVRNELVVVDYSGPMGQKLENLRNFIKNNLVDIKEDRNSHAAWQDIESPNDLNNLSWPRYVSKNKNK